MDSIIWNGNNLGALTKFAEESDFGFVVGSNHGRFKWYHKLFERLSYPRDDKTVLEIYPDRPDEEKSELEKFFSKYDDERLTIVLGTIENAFAEYDAPEYRWQTIGVIRELFAAVRDERNREYTPWHWTTAKVGDRIYSDGSIERKGNDN